MENAGMQDMPTFIVCGTTKGNKIEYIEIVTAETVEEAMDFAIQKYGDGNLMAYRPELCPDNLWEMVKDAVDEGSGSFTGQEYFDYVEAHWGE